MGDPTSWLTPRWQAQSMGLIPLPPYFHSIPLNWALLFLCCFSLIHFVILNISVVCFSPKSFHRFHVFLSDLCCWLYRYGNVIIKMKIQLSESEGRHFTCVPTQFIILCSTWENYVFPTNHSFSNQHLIYKKKTRYCECLWIFICCNPLKKDTNVQ